MARAETLMFGPLSWSVVTAGTANAAATATKAAETGKNHIVSGVSISASAAPAAAVKVTLKDGTTTIDQWEIPAAAFAPIVIEFKRPFVITAGTLVELNIPALGGTTTATAVLRGMTAVA